MPHGELSTMRLSRWLNGIHSKILTLLSYRSFIQLMLSASQQNAVDREQRSEVSVGILLPVPLNASLAQIITVL